MRRGANRSPFIPNGIMRLGKDIVNQREGNKTACVPSICWAAIQTGTEALRRGEHLVSDCCDSSS